ncbi:MAG TPA: hypothetical protein VEK34_11930 [Methylocella sp.]|nr:hypothetical protein [Methylocella sp.]
MAAYPELSKLVLSLEPGASEDGFFKVVVPYLVDVWLSDYARYASTMDVVETRASTFSYLFDVAAERLIAAWGVSRGRHSGERDKRHMAGHPNSAGPLYHRGHVIPHTLGGPTDINLVPQLGRINVGPFRPLEKRAVATPGSFYFTYWTYFGSVPARGGSRGQTPTGVDQGLLVAGQQPVVVPHGN